MHSTANAKVKTTEGKKVGVHSQAHNTSRVEGHVRAPRWGLVRLTSKSITYMNVQKPNNKLVSA
jgi:hypothetical protein